MNRATTSVLPYFTHRRMIPKWIAFAATGATAIALQAPHALLLFAIGVLLFFPSEYLVHRGVFHYFAHKPAGRILSRQHVAHHETPEDLDYLFNDPRISITVGALYFAVFLAATRDVGASAALSFGNFVGLVYYEHVHFTAHRPGATPVTPWGRFLRRVHLWHHFKNEHYWFGVTSPAFDFIFKSWRDPKRVEASPTVRTLLPRAEEVEWMRSK